MRLARGYVLASCLSLFLGSAPAWGHFAWLGLSAQEEPELFFGESPFDKTYHWPAALGDAAPQWIAPGAAPQVLEMTNCKEPAFVGRRAGEAIPQRGVLVGQMPYGIYHGMLLTYHTQLLLDADPGAWSADPIAELPFQALLRATTTDGVEAQFLWRGQPLADAEVSLTWALEQPTVEVTTDAAGKAEFALDHLPDALLGLRAGISIPKGGEHQGEAYQSEMHYLTVVFRRQGKASSDAATPGDDATASCPPLPEPIASFGAASSDGWAYVYGGHTGTEHEHSRDNLSGAFCRLPLSGAAAWEILPSGPPLQGLAIAAFAGKIYRIGGLDARNAADEEADLHSVADVACFDPVTNTWTPLPSLPEARSSHNACVLDGILYVVGGWKLAGGGGDEGVWSSDTLALDLRGPQPAWKSLPGLNHPRRALALAAVDGKIVAIGGLTEEGKPTTRAEVYDPSEGSWSDFADLPGQPMHGFGAAACSHANVLYVSGLEGTLYALDSQALAGGDRPWQEAGRLSPARFFHQLVPCGGGRILAIGGASHEEGHTAMVEVVELASAVAVSAE